jgi:hypothetical protein
VVCNASTWRARARPCQRGARSLARRSSRSDDDPRASSPGRDRCAVAHEGQISTGVHTLRLLCSEASWGRELPPAIPPMRDHAWAYGHRRRSCARGSSGRRPATCAHSKAPWATLVRCKASSVTRHRHLMQCSNVRNESPRFKAEISWFRQPACCCETRRSVRGSFTPVDVVSRASVSDDAALACDARGVRRGSVRCRRL